MSGCTWTQDELCLETWHPQPPPPCHRRGGRLCALTHIHIAGTALKIEKLSGSAQVSSGKLSFPGSNPPSRRWVLWGGGGRYLGAAVSAVPPAASECAGRLALAACAPCRARGRLRRGGARLQRASPGHAAGFGPRSVSRLYWGCRFGAADGAHSSAPAKGRSCHSVMRGLHSRQQR